MITKTLGLLLFLSSKSISSAYEIYSPSITTNTVCQGIISDKVWNSDCETGFPVIVTNYVHRGSVSCSSTYKLTGSKSLKYVADGSSTGSHGYSIKEGSSSLAVLVAGRRYWVQAGVYIPSSSAATPAVKLLDYFNSGALLASTSTKDKWILLGGYFTAAGNFSSGSPGIMIRQDNDAVNSDSFYIDNFEVFPAGKITYGNCETNQPILYTNSVHRGVVCLVDTNSGPVFSGKSSLKYTVTSTSIGAHGFSIVESSPSSVLTPGKRYWAEVRVYIPSSSSATPAVKLLDYFNSGALLASTSVKDQWVVLEGGFIAQTNGYIMIRQDNNNVNTDSFYMDDIEISEMPGAATAYNHMASIVSWNGSLYAAWQGRQGVHELVYGRNIYISKSTNGLSWSDPEAFLLGMSGLSINPLRSYEDFLANCETQPGLLAYSTNELWCMYLSGGGQYSSNGIHLSKYNGTQWTNRLVLTNPVTINAKQYTPYPCTDPVKLSSGRVVYPLTMISRSENYTNTTHYTSPTVLPYRYVCLMYTDNGGTNWNLSNLVTVNSEPGAVWETFLHEQYDGKLRIFCRNFLYPLEGYPMTQSLYTATATGVATGSDLIVGALAPSETVSHGNTANSIQSSGGRFIMFHNDTWSTSRNYTNRQNGALFFSHSGMDDFAAGVRYSSDGKIVGCPRGMEYNDKLFVIYSRDGNPANSSDPRSVDVAVVNPSPAFEDFYIMPRGRRFLGGSYIAPSNVVVDSRICLRFQDHGSAGIETERVDFSQGDELAFEFSFKIEALQSSGKVVVFSYGDKNPVRFALHADAPTMLKVMTSLGWQNVRTVAVGGWYKLTTTFSSNNFTAQINTGPVKSYSYPMTNMNPRLYFGDGYYDPTTNNNIGSSFLIDVNSVVGGVL